MRFLILSTEAGSDSRLTSLGQRRTCSTIHNGLAAKTIAKIPRAEKRVEGPIGAAKWDVTTDQNLALFKAREDEKDEKEARMKEAEET